MNKKNQCPVCGTNNLKTITQKESIKGDLGKELVIDMPHEKCVECGSEGDFSGENEKAIEKALSALDAQYIDEALSFLEENNISFAGIERAVGLPQRTLTKWKNGNSTPTAAGIALLKFLRLFPWLIEVADNKFDFDTSQKIFIGTALNKFINTVNFNNGDELKKGA